MVGYWCNMVGFGPKSDKKNASVLSPPEMTQKELETVLIASGGPGNLFYSITTSFYIIKKKFFFL